MRRGHSYRVGPYSYGPYSYGPCSYGLQRCAEGIPTTFRKPSAMPSSLRKDWCGMSGSNVDSDWFSAASAESRNTTADSACPSCFGCGVYGYGLVGCGLYNYDLCGYGLFGYGLYSYGLLVYGLYSYGLLGYVLYTHGLFGLWPIEVRPLWSWFTLLPSSTVKGIAHAC